MDDKKPIKHQLNTLSPSFRANLYGFLSVLELWRLIQTNKTFSEDKSLWRVLLVKVFGTDTKTASNDNEPKKSFKTEIGKIKEAIAKLTTEEAARKAVLKFLVTGELKKDDKFLSDKNLFSKIFTQLYNIATEHNTVLSLKTLNLNFDLSTPENQGTYMAKWLLENLDFPFEREVNEKIKKSDKNLFSEMPGRKKLNFQTKNKLHAIFPFYESEYDTLITKEKLQEDQCSLMVLNLSNLRYYENNSMDTEHAASFKLMQEQLNFLIKYLNDENNTEFKKAFLDHKGVYGNNNKYQISDFFVEDDKGQVKVTRLLCTLVYNNKNNLWLLSHGMNTQKSAKDTMDWLGSLGQFGEQCLEAIKKAGGVHDGPLLQWVYHADETLYFEIKLEVPAPREDENEKEEKKSKKKEPVKMVTVTKKFQMPAVINKKTQERDTPKGLGQFIVEWFLKSDVGKIQTKLSKNMFEKISIPFRKQLLELRALNTEGKEKFEQYQKNEKKIERAAEWLVETYESLEKAAENESQHSSESGASQEDHKGSYSSLRDETFSRLWHNYRYDKRIRKYVEILLEAFFPEGEENWQQNRENAKKELIGEVKDVKFALLPKEQIKELKNYVKKEVKEKTMLENDENGDFKTPQSKPKHKLHEVYKKGNKENLFSDISKQFVHLGKTKEQRELELIKKQLEQANQVIKEKNEKLNQEAKEKEMYKRLYQELLKKEDKSNESKENSKKIKTSGTGLGFFDRKEEELPSLKLGNFSELENFLKQNDVENYSETINELKNATDNNQLNSALQNLWSLVHEQHSGDGDIMNPLKVHINKITLNVENYTFNPNNQNPNNYN